MPGLPAYQATTLHRVCIPITYFLSFSKTANAALCSNDAVVPISDSHPGCPADPNGLCSFDNVISVLQNRIADIDFNYDCFANYTAKAGVNYNGRAPKS